MVSTVTARPSHYETLGVKPTATSEEIERAFSQNLLRPRAFGGLAEVSIAYETLRDPAKRREYDDSIGVRPEPLPPTARPHEVQFSGSAQFLLSAFAASREPRSEPAAAPPPAPAPAIVAEPRTAEFIAASLREPEPSAGPLYEPASHPFRRGESEEGPVRWKRTAMILGAPVIAVALAGAWAGSIVGNNAAEAEPSDEAVTVALPKAKPEGGREESAAPAWTATESQANRRRHAAVATPRREGSAGSQPRALSDRELDELQPVNVGARSSAFGDGTTLAEEASTAAASMPISNASIARTLARVGYSCGQVVSTAAVASDTPGIFKVTCASGHSYRAAPVNGRYRFGRWKG
jgi:hypothetical protein